MQAQAPDPTAEGLDLIRHGLGQYAIGMGLLTLFLFVADGLCGVPCGPRRAFWVSSFALVALSALSIKAFVQMLRRDANALWTPAALFPLGTFLFFGFGSMSTLFSSEMTQRVLLAGNYSLDAVGLMRTLYLTCLGVTTALCLMILGLKLKLGSGGGPQSGAGITLPMTAVFFVVAGGVLQYGFVLPAQYEMINLTVPGTLKSLAGMTDLGLAVMAFMAARGNKFWALVFWIIWPMHLGLSTLTFSKKVVVFAVLLPAAGAFLGHHSWRRLIPWILLAGFLFSNLQDINTTGRLTIKQRTGEINRADFSERFDILGMALSGEIQLADFATTTRAAAQIWWLRLNYSGAQLQAMQLYDSGRPGEWTLSVEAVFIPRFLWPEKPKATSQGRAFNQTVSGNFDARARVGMSVYADGYWQMGWPGLLLFSGFMGLILGVVTRINYRFVVERQLIFLPVILLGMNLAALGPMGFLQKNFVGGMPIYLGYLGIISLLQVFIRSSAKNRRPPPGAVPAVWTPE